MDNSLLSLISLLLLVTAASAELLVSIDCGASKPHTDENNIEWVTDASQIANGKTYIVKTSETIPETLKTLRAFTSRKKNCYPIAVDSGTQVLVRASFYYGNYDGKALPPSFELQLDGNKWSTVETKIDEEVNYEVVYLVAGNGISVCIAQSTDAQVPFVSAIQVSQLEDGMYAHSSGGVMTGLFLHRRVAFGASRTIRYPDDPYDRIWEPSISSNSLSVSKTESTVNSDASDSPPISVLQTLVTPSQLSTSLSIPLLTNLPSSTVSVYINLYFNDMINSDILTTRSFVIYIDGEPLTETISLFSGQVLEYFVSKFTASGSNKFELKATADSSLAPIISAMEVFSISEELSNTTDSLDMDGLATLINKFDVLQDWNGDPCLPVSYNWDWVDCSSDNPPRITALHLGGFGLSGELPDFSRLTALETIDMRNNSITGGLPDFLGEFSNLKELNLANNKLSGPVPSSLADNKNIKLVIDGNPDLCESGQSCPTFSSGSTPNSPDQATDFPTTSNNNKNNNKNKKKKKSNVGLISGLTIPLTFTAFVGGLVTYFLRSRKAANTTASVNPGPVNQQKPPGNNGGPIKKTMAHNRNEDNNNEISEEDVINEVVVEVEGEMNEENHGENSDEHNV